jgi:hypothetical protein
MLKRKKVLNYVKSKIALTIAFCAFNTNQQFIPNALYAKLNYNTTSYNVGNQFNTNTSSWTPVKEGEQPKIVKLSGQIYITGGAGYPPNVNNPMFVVKVYKTNGDYLIGYPFTGIGQPDIGLPGVVTIQLNGQDLANPGDTYSLYLYANSSPDGKVKFKSIYPGTVMIDDSKYHNFWCGSD